MRHFLFAELNRPNSRHYSSYLHLSVHTETISAFSFAGYSTFQVLSARTRKMLAVPVTGQVATLSVVTTSCLVLVWTWNLFVHVSSVGFVLRAVHKNNLVRRTVQHWRTEWGFKPHPPKKFRRPSKIVPNSTLLWKLLKIAEFRTPTPQDVRKKRH